MENNRMAENIQLLRKRAGMSQEQLAEVTGSSRQTVSKWENGESIPDILACEKMAEAFGVSLEDMLHYEEEKNRLPLPPKGKHMFGTVTVGTKGQIVLPKKAREIFRIKAGDALVVLGDEQQGLALLKAEDMLEFVRAATKQMERESKERESKEREQTRVGSGRESKEREQTRVGSGRESKERE